MPTQRHLNRRRTPLRSTHFVLLLAALTFGLQAVVVGAQDEHAADATAAVPTAADPWAALRQLVGTWEGEIDGKLGVGKGVRRYEMILGDRFLLARHRSVRLPQEKSPEGDEHEELAVFSYDRQRETIVLREFMSEGVVVRSPCEIDGNHIVCVAEAVESGPGIRARLTLEIADRYRFTEIYELGFPGREVELYFTNRWTRSAEPSLWD